MADSLKKYRVHLVLSVAYLAVLIGVVYVLRRPEPRVITITTPSPRPTATIAMIEVQLSGAVNQAGVYTLPLGSRLADVLDLAGGTRADADLLGLNLARKLRDGEAITVPARTPTAAEQPAAAPGSTPAPPPAATLAGRININTASLEELDRLPHIGPALAQRIIDYRLQNGPFQATEEIKNVKGIGDAVFEEIKDLITVASQ